MDVKKPAHQFLSELDEVNYNLCKSSSIEHIIRYLTTLLFSDDPEVFQNAPVGLQVVGRTLEEEAVIAMTEIVDGALKASDSA